MRAKPVGHKSVGDVTASFCVKSLGCTHTDLQGVISPSTGAEQFIRFFLFNYKFGFQLLLTQCNLDKEFCINSQSKALVLSCDINQAHHLFPSTDLAHCLVQLESRRWRGNIWSKTSTKISICEPVEESLMGGCSCPHLRIAASLSPDPPSLTCDRGVSWLWLHPSIALPVASVHCHLGLPLPQMNPQRSHSGTRRW